MPTISIFIRNNDLPLWKQLENKSEWLHKHLHGAANQTSASLEMRDVDPESIEGQVIDAGYTFVEFDDGQAHCKDKSGEDFYFDVKFGRVFFP